MITQYFYFLLFNLLLAAYDDWINNDWVNDFRYFLVFIFLVIINLGLIFIVNHYKVFIQEFLLNKKRKSPYNLMSAIIGFAFSIIFLVLKN
jgi:hypothetical protein